MTDTTTYCQSLGDEVVSTFSSCKTCLVEECFWCKPKDGELFVGEICQGSVISGDASISCSVSSAAADIIGIILIVLPLVFGCCGMSYYFCIYLPKVRSQMLSDSNYLSQSDIENDIDEKTKVEIKKASKISPAPPAPSTPPISVNNNNNNNEIMLNNQSSKSKDNNNNKDSINSTTNHKSESDETREASQISD